MTARLATAKEIRANGAVVALLLKLGGIFSLQTEKRTAWRSLKTALHNVPHTNRKP